MDTQNGLGVNVSPCTPQITHHWKAPAGSSQNSNYIPGKLELDRPAVVAGSPNSRPMMIELSSRGCLAHGKHYCGSTTYFSRLSLRFPMLLECWLGTNMGPGLTWGVRITILLGSVVFYRFWLRFSTAVSSLRCSLSGGLKTVANEEYTADLIGERDAVGAPEQIKGQNRPLVVSRVSYIHIQFVWVILHHSYFPLYFSVHSAVQILSWILISIQIHDFEEFEI